MIFGVGVDIISISRIHKAYERFGERFLDRVLTQKERETFSYTPETLSGIFAAKEACAKALKCGIGSHLSFQDLLVSKSPAPKIELLDSKIDKKFELSISHDGNFAIAVCVALSA